MCWDRLKSDGGGIGRRLYSILDHTEWKVDRLRERRHLTKTGYLSPSRCDLEPWRNGIEMNRLAAILLGMAISLGAFGAQQPAGAGFPVNTVTI